MGGGFYHEEPVAIPASIKKLKKLQTLWGADFSRYKFPREICELEDLRHIRFHKGGFKIQSNQTKLQTVDTIKYSDWIQIDTVNLLDLRALSITSVEGEEVSEEGTAYSWESIAKLTSLETFNFYFSHYLMIPSIRPLSYCENLQSVCLSGPIKDPSELRFLPESVTNLSLSKTKFTQDPMPTLASLSNITALDLGEGTYTGEKMVCSDNTFPCLQFLKLVGHPNLKEWHVEDGAMPSLRGLYIDDCDNMMIPERLNCVPPTPDFTELIYEKKKREIVAQHARELLEGYLMRSPTGETTFILRKSPESLLGRSDKRSTELRFLPESVTNLSLSETKLTQDPMPTLASLSNLTALDLGEGMYTGEKMVCSNNTFPCLQFLKLIGHPDMKEWHVEDEAMSCLKGIYIDDCDNLMIPERLNCVPPTPDFTKLISIKEKKGKRASRAKDSGTGSSYAGCLFVPGCFVEILAMTDEH
ncbi:probable disease resistance protein RF9 [Daucus carota subsp. sativus]|uniref:probable disease resistance protein RF9 n=1 Tax=Daucus carota subsp. sativus TaxID=79200 RepID=UPI003083CBE3